MTDKTRVTATDPAFEETVLKWFEEINSDNEENRSEYEDNIENISEHESIMSEDSDQDDLDDKLANDIIVGRNGYKWSTKEPPQTKTQSRNIVIKLPGAQGPAKHISNEPEAWKILFDDAMIECIVTCTNQEIERQRVKYKENTRYVHPTDSVEILAIIGFLYISGARKDAHLSIKDLYSNEAPRIYKCIMGEVRLRFLLDCLRFDDKDNRNREDKFAPVRQLWESFIRNCTASYVPHAYCTIDEQLLGFRGNCPFRVYIASKPDKYGIKIYTMCDSRTYYMINAIPYIGKEVNRSDEPLAHQLVKKLSLPIHGTNRNLTMDNYFTSIPLADDILKNCNLTIVGTLRRNKKEIPPSFLPNRKKPVLSSDFAFCEKKTLVSFTPKKAKSVILLSTFHSSKSVDSNTKKPEIIHFYNSTKGGVDTFDQMVHNFSVSRKTRRWPLRLFYGMLDQAAINAYVIHNLVQKPNAAIRRKFLEKLGFELARPYMERRLQNILPQDLRKNINDILGKTVHNEVLELPAKRPKSGRCYLCPRNRDRKTKMWCLKCNKPVCVDHRRDVCNSCSM